MKKALHTKVRVERIKWLRTFAVEHKHGNIQLEITSLVMGATSLANKQDSNKHLHQNSSGELSALKRVIYTDLHTEDIFK